MEKENKKLLKLRDSIIMLKVFPFTSLFFVCYQFYIYFVYKIVVKAENYELFSPLIKDVSLNDNIKETLLGNPFFYLITLYLAFLFLFINPVITFLADTKMYRFLKNDYHKEKFPPFLFMIACFGLIIVFMLTSSNDISKGQDMLSKYNFIFSLYYIYLFGFIIHKIFKILFNLKLYIDFLKYPKKYDGIGQKIYKNKLKLKEVKKSKKNIEVENKIEIVIENV